MKMELKILQLFDNQLMHKRDIKTKFDAVF